MHSLYLSLSLYINIYMLAFMGLVCQAQGFYVNYFTVESSEKFEVTSIFRDFDHIVETQFNAKIAILRSDSGREFQNHTLNEFLPSKGIVHQSSCAYIPQQNVVFERKNRHLMEVAHYLLLSTSLPSYMWGCCSYCTYPSTCLIPEVPHCVFGCTAYVHRHGPNQVKFTHRALVCVFVGYSLHQRGYKCFHPSSRKYFISMDVSCHFS